MEEASTRPTSSLMSSCRCAMDVWAAARAWARRRSLPLSRSRPRSMAIAKPAPGTLVLLRHGQSTWNLENLFTGWHDVPLSEHGVAEAKEAGRVVSAGRVAAAWGDA